MQYINHRKELISLEGKTTVLTALETAGLVNNSQSTIKQLEKCRKMATSIIVQLTKPLNLFSTNLRVMKKEKGNQISRLLEAKKQIASILQI